MRDPEMCFFCVHNSYSKEEIKKGLYNRGFDWEKVRISCDAYPNGIPKAVFIAGHLYPKPNDNGIQFEGDNPFTDDITQEKEDSSYYFIKKYLEEQAMSPEEYKAKFGKDKPERWLEDVDDVP